VLANIKQIRRHTIVHFQTQTPYSETSCQRSPNTNTTIFLLIIWNRKQSLVLRLRLSQTLPSFSKPTNTISQKQITNSKSETQYRHTVKCQSKTNKIAKNWTKKWPNYLTQAHTRIVDSRHFIVKLSIETIALKCYSIYHFRKTRYYYCSLKNSNQELTSNHIRHTISKT
jgi:hypothetical protein